MVKHCNKIIKESIAYRAKYRIHKAVFLSPWSVVPHPKNRGGEVVKSSRTRQIGGMINKGGYDDVEVYFRAVAVEGKPAVAEENLTFRPHLRLVWRPTPTWPFQTETFWDRMAVAPTAMPLAPSGILMPA